MLLCRHGNSPHVRTILSSIIRLCNNSTEANCEGYKVNLRQASKRKGKMVKKKKGPARNFIATVVEFKRYFSG